MLWHAGIPWLLYLRRQLSERVHFWPFDGWQIPAGRSAVLEVYPALWKHAYAVNGRTADQHDAYSAAAWLRQADLNGQLARFLNPGLTPSQRTVAGVEVDSRRWVKITETRKNASWRCEPPG